MPARVRGVGLAAALALVTACASNAPRAAAVSAVPESREAGYVAPPSPEPVPPIAAPVDSAGLRLARHTGFSQAMGDARRLGIVAEYTEDRPGRLILDLGPRYSTASTVEYHIKRIYSAYGDYLNHNFAPVVELRLEGQVVGDYTWEGMSTPEIGQVR
jgi:hypothetical protein